MPQQREGTNLFDKRDFLVDSGDMVRGRAVDFVTQTYSRQDLIL